MIEGKKKVLKIKVDLLNRTSKIVKIGKDLKLFMTHKLVGAGLPMYLPDGATIRRVLERYIQDKELALGYWHVYTPDLANAITKLPDLSLEDYLAKLKDAFPQYNESYDIWSIGSICYEMLIGRLVFDADNKE